MASAAVPSTHPASVHRPGRIQAPIAPHWLQRIKQERVSWGQGLFKEMLPHHLGEVLGVGVG